MEISICKSRFKWNSELADPGPSTSCDKALSCPDQNTCTNTSRPLMIEVAIQLVDPCNQPRSSLSSTISPAFQSLNFNGLYCFLHMMTLLYSIMLQRDRWNKILVTWIVSSLFMRCDENMIFICVIQNYMVFIHDSHQPNIHPFN